MKRFMLGLTTIVALVAMTLLGLTVPAAHADDGSPSGPMVTPVTDYVSVYAGYTAQINVLQNDIDHVGAGLVLESVSGGTPNAEGGTANYPSNGDVIVYAEATQSVSFMLTYWEHSAAGCGSGMQCSYQGTIVVTVIPLQPTQVRKVRKGVFRFYDPNPPNSVNAPLITYLTCKAKAAQRADWGVRSFQLKSRRAKVIKLSKHLKICRSVKWSTGYPADVGSYQTKGTLRYPFGKKAYKKAKHHLR